jgi:hypothetical protein
MVVSDSQKVSPIGQPDRTMEDGRKRFLFGYRRHFLSARRMPHKLFEPSSQFLCIFRGGDRVTL